MNFVEQMLRRRQTAVLIVGGVALAAVGVLDCTFMQVMSGGFDSSRTLLWSLATLAPMMLATSCVAARPASDIALPVGVAKFAAAVCLALAGVVAIDSLVFPTDGMAEWPERARSKLPGALSFVALGVWASWSRQHCQRTENGAKNSLLTAGESFTIATAKIVRAAGNYVEVQSPSGNLQLIRIPIGIVTTLPEARGLVRLHRSVLVREAAIVRWRNDRSGLVAAQLDDGTTIRISRTYRQAAYQLRSCNSSPNSCRSSPPA